MRGQKYYHLAAIKSYFLAQEYHNVDLKNYVKDTYFNNLFTMYKTLSAYDDNNKVLIHEDDLHRITIPISPLIKKISIDANLYPRILSNKAFKIKNTNNSYILETYTKNYTKNNFLKGRQNIINKAIRYKTHILNLKKIHSFNMILSFDFEYNDLSKEGVSEIGIAIYYPKQETFIYKHILIEGKECTVGKKSVLQKQFNFGETEVLTKIEAFKILNDYIKKADILLAHDIINELHILSIKPEWSNIIDTKICELILDPQDKYLSLKDTLKKHNLSSVYLHNAGNDAAYAIHLAIKMYNEITHT